MVALAITSAEPRQELLAPSQLAEWDPRQDAGRQWWWAKECKLCSPRNPCSELACQSVMCDQVIVQPSHSCRGLHSNTSTPAEMYLTCHRHTFCFSKSHCKRDSVSSGRSRWDGHMIRSGQTLPNPLSKCQVTTGPKS